MNISDSNSKLSKLFALIKGPFIIVSVVVAVLFVLLFYWYHFNDRVLSESTTQWAEFGDYVGGTLNPILAFFSVVFLLKTITIQSKELKATRKELKHSARAQEQSSTALKKQNFYTEQQIEKLRVKEKKEDIHQIISVIDRKINTLLENKCESPLGSKHTSLQNGLRAIKEPHDEQKLFEKFMSTRPNEILFGDLKREYMKLKEYLDKFDELAEHTFLSSYYEFHYDYIENVLAISDKGPSSES